MNEECNSLVKEIAKLYMEYSDEKFSGWSKAFYRIRALPSQFGGNGSYINGDEVELIGVFDHEELLEPLHKLFKELWQALESIEKEFIVCLLVVDSEYNFNIYFDYEDPEKWSISKLDGGIGIPVGYEQLIEKSI
ncbi:hypothetical protein [Pelagibaculum spongiae]|uniref:DUF600 domain-containing protein n=1 Tax=Pelagibaculum spongiae TaxID=2080658 RepID=A0A2V1GZA8_9GAMM|nr:hypothetical protein [Pelagibaculum spongiae]PVZ66700.1 hypothetical protein DC094_15640 [Pelagibaculum spongiae]